MQLLHRRNFRPERRIVHALINDRRRNSYGQPRTKNRNLPEAIASPIRRAAGSKLRGTRIGLIGAGHWATTNHIPLFRSRDDVEMVSVYGLDEKVLGRCQRYFGFQHLTTDYRENATRKTEKV
jgi:hypothetical protein